MKKFKNHIISIIICLGFFIATSTFAQSEHSKIDSLNKLASDLTYSNIDSAFVIARQANDLSISINYSKGIGYAYFTIGTSFFLIEKVDSALFYLNKSINTLEAINNIGILTRVYSLLGMLQGDNQNFTEAIKSYNYALELNKEAKDSLKMCFSYTNIGVIFGRLGDIKKEMDYLTKGFEISSHFKNSGAYAFSLDCIGLHYIKLKQFDKAENYFTKEMDIIKDLDQEEIIAQINMNFATLHLAQGNLESALTYINKSIIVYRKIGNVSYEIVTSVTKIEILEKLKMYDKAILLTDKLLKDFSEKMNSNLLVKVKYIKGKLNYNIQKYSQAKNNLESLLALPISSDNLEAFRDTYKLLYEIAEIEKNIPVALQHFKKYTSLSDSINILDANAKSLDFEHLSELRQKEKEIEDLKKDKIIANLEISSHKSFRNFLYLTFGLLGIIILIVILNNLRMRSINKKLKLLNESEERFLRIISHDIRNSLGAVINFSNMLINDKYILTEEEADDSVAEINKAALATNNLLTNLLQWTLAKKNGLSFNPKTEILKDVVTDGISSSLSLVKIKELKLTVNVDEKINVFIDSYSISSVVRNLLTNAIKFSNLRGEIIFDASVANNFVKLSLKDTGLGMDAATVDTLFNENNHSTTKGTNNEKGTGIGISLVKRFVQMNGGTIKVESKLGVGSTFTFSMPLGKKSSNDKNQVVDLPNKNKKPVSTEKIRKIAI